MTTAALPIMPLAVVRGAPVDALPDDLYIPPDALRIFLEAFEGPLDLLLYLIKRQNLDIVDIPIARITEQYLGYIDMMSALKMELAAEYLVMAAWLAEIKSRLLLPRAPIQDDDEDDPRALLIKRLRMYEVMKNAAEGLNEWPRLERDIWLAQTDLPPMTLQPEPPTVELDMLLNAWQALLKRADQHRHHRIVQEPLSVRERMSLILERLHHVESVAFPLLFKLEEGRQGVLVTFLAILELSKEGLISIMQAEPLTMPMIAVAGKA
ncbi:MAG: ScpA family protein [Methylococcales bacterium]|nr:ScpA family protein [Methylococcales bacterium]